MELNAFSRYLKDVYKARGKAWTVSDISGLVGYGFVAPVPGLESILDLQGCIVPNKRRKGYGSQLLTAIIDSMRKSGRFQLSHAVHSLASPTALFLKSQQFVIEHVEWQLMLDNPGQLTAVLLPPAFNLTTYQTITAVRTFRQVYDAAFDSLPWYQPYTNDSEVTADLESSSDLVFLLDGEKTAGFAWLKMPEPDLGEIEPFGLLPAYQGRGLGMVFLTAVIHRLVSRGAKHIRIGAWQRNERAIHLYQQLGFTHLNTQTYLAYDIY
jgi:mycothiol synthase